MNNEINESEIFLKSLKTQGGFEVPQNYFEELEEQTRSISFEPKLDFGTDTGFSVPEGYFANLEQSILKKVQAPQAKIIPFYKKTAFRIGVSIAAAAVLVSMLFLFRTPSSTTTSTDTAFTNEEIINHLSEEDINVELLCDAGWCNEIEKLNKQESNELDNYMIEHNEEDLLIEEL